MTFEYAPNMMKFMSVKVHLDKEGVTSGRMCFTLSAGSLINQQKSELGFTFPVMYLPIQ